MADKARENRLRRMAKRLGLELRKSRARSVHVDDLGKYQLVNPDTDTVLSGNRFELSLDQVQQRLEEEERRIKEEAEGGDNE